MSILACIDQIGGGLDVVEVAVGDVDMHPIGRDERRDVAVSKVRVLYCQVATGFDQLIKREVGE